MLATLMVPVDGSECARRALPFAAGVAQRAGGRVILVHVGGASGEAVLDDASARLRALHVPAGAHLRAASEGQSTADAILAAARELAADLLVMSTHGRGALSRAILGSVADGVLRAADRPLLLVPPRAAPAWPSTGRALVLVALDGSSLAEQTLAPVVELATALRGEVVLASVVVPPPMGYGYFAEPSSPPLGYDAAPDLNEARGYLEEVADRLAPSSLSVRVRAEVGVVVDTLLRLAADEGAWVVALGTHGYGGVARVALGSVAADLLRCVTVPLLVVRGVVEGSGQKRLQEGKP